jgi:hypothetical protein
MIPLRRISSYFSAHHAIKRTLSSQKSVRA